MSALKEVLRNEALPLRLRVESIAFVALGLRPMSLVMLPADLYNGDVLGREIDNLYQRRLYEGTHGSLLQRFYTFLLSHGKHPVEYKKAVLHRAYEDIVPCQSSYKAIISAIDKLSLPYYIYEVRPSIRELYICNSALVRQRLDTLMQEREEIKRKAWANATPETPYSLIIYPEEQVPQYLRKLGELLGLPM